MESGFSKPAKVLIMALIAIEQNVNMPTLTF